MTPDDTTGISGSASDGATTGTDVPVAIVGIGCRYADARGPDELWEIIRSGRDTVRDAPQHRIELGYDVDHFYDPRPRIPGRISSKKGGFLEHPELFDPAAFGIAPRDALTMDPQQRLMVEVTWDALEDAGIVPAEVAGERVAVILGYMAEDYSRERTGVLGEEAVFRGHDVFTVGGMSHAVLSGRISFLLGVTGPSFTLDTACSSSLIATHLACQSLRRGEADMAIAGGANLFLSPEGNIALSRSGMLSMSGACRAFDAGADGFVRAEGAGVVVLKRLPEAIEDGDPIYAVIRGSGISTDGRDGGHMMAPGRKGQAQAMRDAYAQAGVDPSEVQYVETHGTGTMIGDPVEIGALADVMGPGRDPARPLRVASVKGHLGHTESASGVAGLIQACMSIRHRTWPAQMHFETPNPAIPWDEVPIRVQTELEPWRDAGPALVGVNSFGISGTNAHVVLETPPGPGPRPTATPRGRAVVLPVSAHDPKARDEMLRALRARLDGVPSDDAADVLHTLGTSRSRREHRTAVVAESIDALHATLSAHLDGDASVIAASGHAEADRRPQLVMVFPGQGSQWLGMGRSLLADEPVFAKAIDRIDAAYARHVDWSLRSFLETTDAELSAEPARDWTRRLDHLQPVLVAFEIALAELWRSWGIVPDRVIGQSMGEIAAAHVAGALDLETTARLACHRGRIVRQASGRGGMAVIALSREAVESRLPEGVEIAGVNSPTTTIVAGDRAAVTRWIGELESEGVFARVLDVDFASHCFHMDPLLDAFAEGLSDVAPRPAAIPLHSTVDGEVKIGADLDADYWLRNLRSAVAFDGAMQGALEAGGEVFLEVSPHSTLARPIAECAAATGHAAAFVGSLRRDEPDATSLARSVAELFVAGAPVDFAVYGPPGRVTTIPLYAYQRERYWFSERTRLDARRPTHPLLGNPVDSSLERGTRFWTFVLDADSAGFAADYRVDGEPVLPAALLIELALAASDAMWPSESVEICELEHAKPIALGDDARRLAQIVVRPRREGGWLLQVSSRPYSDGRDPGSTEWERHGSAVIRRELSGAPLPSIDPASFEKLGSDPFDAAMARAGVEFGARMRSVRDLQTTGTAEAAARLMLPRSVETEWHAYFAHPALVEAALQLGGLTGDVPRGGRALEILAIDSVSIPEGLGSDALVRVIPVVSDDADANAAIRFDCHFHDASGAPVGAIRGVRARVRPERTRANANDDTRLAAIEWHPWTLPAGAANEAVTRWVLFSHEAARAQPLATELRKRGASCDFCSHVDALDELTRRFAVDARRPWGLVVLESGDLDIASLGLAAADAALAWIVTDGRLHVDAEDAPSRPDDRGTGTALRSFARAFGPGRCHFFDRSAAANTADDAVLARALLAVPAERCLASRGATAVAPRLVAVQAEPAASRAIALRPAGDRNFRAERSEGARRTFEGGHEAGVVLRPRPEPDPGPADVIVEVMHASLSRLDVEASLAPQSASAAPFGHDFVGRVVAIGDDVDACAIGGIVCGLRRGSLERRIAVEEDAVLPVGPGVDPADLAILPAFVADHALHVAARLTAGERVLVDAGYGPVAHALVRAARAAGADVQLVARSGSPPESLLRAGAEVVRAGENGPPVSLIVSSQSSGDAATPIGARLAPTGRCIDLRPPPPSPAIDPDPITVGPNQSVTRIDSIGLIETQPELARDMLERVAAQALAPGRTRFPIGELERALRYAAQRRHGAGVVVDFETAEGASLVEPARAETLSEHVGAVVVRGGSEDAVEALRAVIRDADLPCTAVAAFDDACVEDAVAARLEVTHLGSASTSQPTQPDWEVELWLDLLARPIGIGERRLAVPGGLPADANDLQRRLLAAASARPASTFVALDAALPESAFCAAVAGGDGEAPDLSTMSDAERRDRVLDLIRAELGTVMGLDADQRTALAASRRLDALGLDSLMSMELFVGLGRTLSLEVSRDWFTTIPTLGEVASVLTDRLGHEGEGPR